MLKYLLVILTSLTLFSSACNSNKNKEKQQKNWDVENTKIVTSFEEINQLAIKEAQDSLSLFLTLLGERRKNNFDFFIKSKFSDGENTEHMWSLVSSVQNDTIFAVLNNVPLRLKIFKLDDKVKVEKGKVEDWSVYKGDSVLYGNFIIKHSR